MYVVNPVYCLTVRFLFLPSFRDWAVIFCLSYCIFVNNVCLLASERCSGLHHFVLVWLTVIAILTSNTFRGEATRFRVGVGLGPGRRSRNILKF